MRATCILLFAAVGVACQSCRAQDAITRALRYEPEVVELVGQLSLEPRPGPPSYGAEPGGDSIVQVPMVTLDKPVSVLADTTSETNAESIPVLTAVQLVFAGGGASYRLLAGRRVTVTGTLSRAVTGHHYTPAVLTVQSINEAR